jgi:hypothetical protein
MMKKIGEFLLAAFSLPMIVGVLVAFVGVGLV